VGRFAHRVIDLPAIAFPATLLQALWQAAIF
jgi:hypothetical protein